MSERPSNLAADATWPTRASSRARVHVVPGTGVRMIPSTVVVPPEPVETPQDFVGGRVPMTPTPDTTDVRPPARALTDEDAERRKKLVAERERGRKR